MLVAGKGLGEEVTNGPAVAAGEGRAREERVGDKGKGEGNRDEPRGGGRAELEQA